MLKFLINRASPLRKLESYNSFLFIGPHPDDIEIGAGATAAKLAEDGKKVKFVIALDGRYGLANAKPGTTPTELIEIRKEEAIASAHQLGVEDITFLGFSDGDQYDKRELLIALAKEIGKVQPEVIFAPDPSLSSECHQDHINVGEAARELACFAPFKEIMGCFSSDRAPVQAIAYYFTAKPNCYVKTGKHFKTQLSAIFENHLSQFPEGVKDSDSLRLYLNLRSICLGLKKFCFHAEGFRMLDTLRMHCLPEAGK